MIHIAKGGLPWILGSFIITLFFLLFTYCTRDLLSMILLAFSLVFFLISCLLIVFFRDPHRSIGPGVVAVADGKIREIVHLQDPDVGSCVKVSTFMNIHNVHVNRMPLDGTIASIVHHIGGHVPAFTKESDSNERVIFLIKTDIGLMKIVQIAGTVARRIVPYVKQGTIAKKGEKIGLIRLGSRVDVYLPEKRIKELVIHIHDTIKAGEDTIAQIND